MGTIKTSDRVAEQTLDNGSTEFSVFHSVGDGEQLLVTVCLHKNATKDGQVFWCVDSSVRNVVGK